MIPCETPACWGELYTAALVALACLAVFAVAGVSEWFMRRRSTARYGKYRTNVERFAARCQRPKGASWVE